MATVSPSVSPIVSARVININARVLGPGDVEIKIDPHYDLKI